MNEEDKKHSSVGRTFEIDQRATKVFSDFVPDGWLARPQTPDFFLDYLVEIVENGEPTGLNFAVQIKGYEDNAQSQRPLSFAFKTKHLKYYLIRQEPVFLFLIDVANRYGYWLFAQKYLKDNASDKILDDQDYFTIRFSEEDSLSNFTKFRCLLPEAERFVRDLHPGSIEAAIEKRKTYLESKDPRCEIAISIKDGKEHVEITAKETFTFLTKIRSVDVHAWNDFWERGSKLRVQQGQIEIQNSPIFNEAIENCGDLEIQFGNEVPGSVHIISKSNGGKIIPIEGHFRGGTKFFSFRGSLPRSPLEIAFEMSFEGAQKGEPSNVTIKFSPSNWVGQPILSLSCLDQVASFAEAFSETLPPEFEIFINGNTAVKGEMGRGDAALMEQMQYATSWCTKCRWLARHYQVNPVLPPADKLGEDKMFALLELYELLTKREMILPSPGVEISFCSAKPRPVTCFENGDGILRIQIAEQTIDFFGIPVSLGPTQHVLTDMKFVSQITVEDGKVDVLLRGSEKTMRTSSLKSGLMTKTL